MKPSWRKRMAIMLSIGLAAFAWGPPMGGGQAYGAQGGDKIPLEYAAPWTGYANGNVDATASIDRNVAYEGSRSLHLANRTPKAPHTYYVVRQKIAVEPNTKYRISAWVKGNQAGASWFGDWGARVYLPTGNFDWQKKTSVFTTGANQTEFTFLLLTEQTTTDLWYDDVMMTKDGSDVNLLQNAGFEEGEAPDGPIGEEPVALGAFLRTLGEKTYLPMFRTGSKIIDGSLSDWNDSEAISLPADESRHVRLPGWGGENDLSAKAEFAYDDNHMYVNFVVKDQAHVGVEGASMWSGDSIQVGFSSDGTVYETEYGFAVVHGEPQVWRWLNGSATLPKESVELAARRDEANKTTIYEAKLPWKAIFAGKPGHQFRFSFLANDNDSNSRRGYVQWTDGIGLGKQAGKLGTAYLIEPTDSWLAWLDEKKEIRSGETYAVSLDLLNVSGSDVLLNISSDELELNRQVAVPANKASRLRLEKQAPEIGEHHVRVTVTEAASGRKVRHETSFAVYETDEQLIDRFDRLSLRLPALEAKLEEAGQRGIPTDYERINATVIRNFVDYGKDDVKRQMTRRATYVAVELEKLYDEAMAKLEGYLDGSLQPQSVPRYRTGSERVEIDGYSFRADAYDSAAGSTERRPVIFTGYGHFDEVRRDIPKFEGYGTNIIQVETGPNRVIVPSEAWTVWSASLTGGVKADISIDRQTVRSGKGSLKIANQSPIAPGVYASVSQRVQVNPNTTYQIKAWVKGENAKNVWFPGGANWSKRQQVPVGTYDWTELTVEYATGPNETVMPFIILSENAGKVWFDDLTMKAVGSDVNLLKFSGFDDDPPLESKGYIASTRLFEEDIVQVLEQAKKHHVAVNLLLSPHYFPNWAKEKWPELKSNNKEFLQFNFDAPKAREIIRDYLEAVIPLVKDYASLHSITLTNEPVYVSYEDADYHMPEFHQYLLQLYPAGIEELNRIYGTNYGSFSEVPMPKSYSPTPAYYDWFTFNNQLFTGWHQWMADIIHDIAPDLPVHVKAMNGMLGADTWGIDWQRMSELSQINGNDAANYLNGGKGGHVRENMMYDFQASLKKAPVFNSEHHVIPDGDHNYIPEQAAHVRTLLWQGALHGRSASTLWVWGRTYDSSSVIDGSIMHRPDVVAVVGRTNLDLNRLVEEVSAFQDDPAEVAVLYSPPAVLYEVRGRYPDSIRNVYEAISLSGVKTGFITDKQLREGKAGSYKAIFVPQQQHVERGTLEALQAYAEAGGTIVVVGAESLQYDERKQPLDASTRESVMSRAVVLEASWSTAELKRWLTTTELYESVNSVVLIDEVLNEPVADVEWRSVNRQGKLLVSLANYGDAARTVSVRVKGRKLGEGVNLIDGSAVNGASVYLPQKTPLLLSWNEPAEDRMPPVTTVEIEGTIGAGDWYVSEATVMLSAYDEGSGVAETTYKLVSVSAPQKPGAGETVDYMKYEGPFRVGEGIYDLSIRSTDAAGNAEEPQTIRLKVDLTAPTVEWTANGSPLPEPAAFPDHQPVSFDAATVDNLSNGMVVRMTVNGNPYAPGTPIDWAGDPGSHTVAATIRDEAGNQAEYAVAVEVTTSVEAIRALMARFTESGELTGPTQTQLDNRLTRAEHHFNDGRTDQAVKHMQDFLSQLDKVPGPSNLSERARTVLAADAEFLIRQWSKP